MIPGAKFARFALRQAGAVAFLIAILGPLGFRLKWSEFVNLMLGKDRP